MLDRVRSRLSGRRSSLYGETTMSSIAAADLLAANDLLGRWSHWMNRRAEVQAKRKRRDEDIFGLFLRPLWCIEQDAAYRSLFAGSTEFFGLTALFDGLTVMPEDPKH